MQDFVHCMIGFVSAWNTLKTWLPDIHPKARGPVGQKLVDEI